MGALLRENGGLKRAARFFSTCYQLHFCLPRNSFHFILDRGADRQRCRRLTRPPTSRLTMGAKRGIRFFLCLFMCNPFSFHFLGVFYILSLFSISAFCLFTICLIYPCLRSPISNPSSLLLLFYKSSYPLFISFFSPFFPSPGVRQPSASHLFTPLIFPIEAVYLAGSGIYGSRHGDARGCETSETRSPGIGRRVEKQSIQPSVYESTLCHL